MSKRRHVLASLALVLMFSFIYPTVSNAKSPDFARFRRCTVSERNIVLKNPHAVNGLNEWCISGHRDHWVLVSADRQSCLFYCGEVNEDGQPIN